jgi:serine/threonine protein kinase
LNGDIDSFKSDIWALGMFIIYCLLSNTNSITGITLIQMADGRPPYADLYPARVSMQSLNW